MPCHGKFWYEYTGPVLCCHSFTRAFCNKVFKFQFHYVIFWCSEQFSEVNFGQTNAHVRSANSHNCVMEFFTANCLIEAAARLDHSQYPGFQLTVRDYKAFEFWWMRERVLFWQLCSTDTEHTMCLSSCPVLILWLSTNILNVPQSAEWDERPWHISQAWQPDV